MGKTARVPRAFFWRRVHSLTGLWLVVFLLEHILTNSQAALLFGDDGGGFVKAVNLLQSLPYLRVIELSLLALPFAIHIFLGVKYLFTGEVNSFASDGSKPSITGYFNNHAYTWQRITSWILIFTLLAHVVHLRFWHYPEHAQIESARLFILPLDKDGGIYTLANRLGVDLWDSERIERAESDFIFADKSVRDPEVRQQILRQKEDFLNILRSKRIGGSQLVAVARDFGTVALLAVRDSFKSVWLMLLYSLFVLAAAFHAFNGLWTFCVTWGITLTSRAQRMMRIFTLILMALVACGGLLAIWATYWINLRN